MQDITLDGKVGVTVMLKPKMFSTIDLIFSLVSFSICLLSAFDVPLFVAPSAHRILCTYVRENMF